MSKLVEIVKNFGKYEIGVDLISTEDRSFGRKLANFTNFCNANYVNSLHLVNAAYSVAHSNSLEEFLARAAFLEAVKFAFNRYMKNYKKRVTRGYINGA